ncbi:MAG: 60S ribosomal protein L31 [Nanoarchaeota archaeon]|nr:60S ribosomal protein L31 [DPANN group archaeon]MBL7117133.1 60S ribosomal protein L31 [Nanoarchaeota archaeon]
MAEKKKPEKKVTLERAYNVPLRKGWLKAPRYKRSKKAVKTLREFLQRHMKSDNIKLGMYVNEHIWKHGIKNPPHHVKVKAVKYDDGTVKAELEGFEFKEAVKAKPKEEKPTGLKGKLQKAMGKEEKEEEVKEEEVKEEKVEEIKKEKKKEAKKPGAKKITKKPDAKKKSTKKTSTKKAGKTAKK